MTTFGEGRALVWQHGVVSVESLGSMLGPTLFVLPDGRQIAPFQIAPWANDPGAEALLPILRRLRGEWPCIPFGSDADRPGDADWSGSSAASALDRWPHGYSSNHHWRIRAVDEGSIEATVDYPDSHPIRRLVRRVTPDSAAAALDFELMIEARADCRLPIGLHPTFRLPEATGAMRIEVAPGVVGMTFPGQVDASSIFARGVLLDRWNEVPLRDGSRLDVSSLPLPYQTEELVQLLEMPGAASLWNSAEGYRVRLSWDPDHFPSALLWLSNRGRASAPWNGRHLALGFEPVCSAFDLGTAVSAGDNPIARRGTATARQFRAGEQFITRYRVAVEPAALA